MAGTPSINMEMILYTPKYGTMPAATLMIAQITDKSIFPLHLAANMKSVPSQLFPLTISMILPFR
jgi:hypothetical protein